MIKNKGPETARNICLFVDGASISKDERLESHLLEIMKDLLADSKYQYRKREDIAMMKEKQSTIGSKALAHQRDKGMSHTGKEGELK